MRIAEIKIRNFRKLKEVTIQLQDDKTVFIGANNSGKTSAMVAMRYFLKQDDHSKFSIYDFTLSNHARIKEIGNKLEAESQKMPEGTSSTESEEFQLLWKNISPSLDLWFDVNDDDIHYVYHILPTLDWAGGNLGIRLQFELSDPAVFYGEYKEAHERIKEIKAKIKNNRDIMETNLFPKDIFDFLKEKLNNYFTVKFYTLDPSKKDDCQLTETLGEPMDSNPLSGLIRVDEINAQRGLNDEIAGTSFSNEHRLSKQLTDYYDKHLDPSKVPTEHDLDALVAIYEAQKIFHDGMTQRFQPALNELGELGYPGFYNPNITINPDIKATDGLDHNSALQYELDNCKGSFLPETYNGLGYQNLIFIAFELISFRDSWLKFGKQRVEQPSKKSIEYPPIHLVLVEEPEAHLHPQAQQVFIKQAYKILTCREESKTGKLKTQLVITTHSSHITHECDFAHLRYFKRVPPKDKQVQGTEVVNLSNVFGSDNDTKKFVSRYIKLTHCDLFFADTAILVEGDAERILLPSFISRFAHVNQSYVRLL
jgi:predicted ATP-dependent endonuclease of OLD family